MRKSARKAITAAILGTAIAVTGLATAAPAQAAKARACSTAWGTGVKAAGTASTAALKEVRTGRHTCFDRVVFLMNGSANGYTVRYANRVAAEGTGRNLVPYTAGEAHLRVQLHAPSTLTAAVGSHLGNVSQYDTLRDVVYGGSTATRTTLAVGVEERRPFRVLQLTGPGTDSRLVLDVAHQ